MVRVVSMDDTIIELVEDVARIESEVRHISTKIDQISDQIEALRQDHFRRKGRSELYGIVFPIVIGGGVSLLVSFLAR